MEKTASQIQKERIKDLEGKADALIEVCIGNAMAKIIDVRKMFQLGEEFLSRDPLYFLCNNENCEHCSGVRKAQKGE